LTWCCKTFKSFEKGEPWKLYPLYQSDLIAGPEVESDHVFVRKLLQAAFAGYERYFSLISESVTGWEKERLFSTDVILIVMGLAEAVNFPTIPVKVTINEYVELSKFYGTPKSRSFVNGLLDRLVQKLSDDGQVVKEGKGLL
jgi:N utilization substance protein B